MQIDSATPHQLARLHAAYCLQGVVLQCRLRRLERDRPQDFDQTLWQIATHFACHMASAYPTACTAVAEDMHGQEAGPCAEGCRIEDASACCAVTAGACIAPLWGFLASWAPRCAKDSLAPWRAGT